MSQLNQETSRPSTKEVRTAEQAALEMSCVDLICQLEHLLATGKEADRGDQVEDSGKLADKMLEKLVEFSDKHLDCEEILEQITKASHAIKVHKSMLGNRSWGATIMSVFIVDAIDENSKNSHVQLGKDLVCVCATVLHQAVQLVGEDSEIGKQIGQSMIVFVDEFETAW